MGAPSCRQRASVQTGDRSRKIASAGPLWAAANSSRRRCSVTMASANVSDRCGSGWPNACSSAITSVAASSTTWYPARSSRRKIAVLPAPGVPVSTYCGTSVSFIGSATGQRHVDVVDGLRIAGLAYREVTAARLSGSACGQVPPGESPGSLDRLDHPLDGPTRSAGRPDRSAGRIGGWRSHGGQSSQLFNDRIGQARYPPESRHDCQHFDRDADAATAEVLLVDEEPEQSADDRFEDRERRKGCG